MCACGLLVWGGGRGRAKNPTLCCAQRGTPERSNAKACATRRRPRRPARGAHQGASKKSAGNPGRKPPWVRISANAPRASAGARSLCRTHSLSKYIVPTTRFSPRAVLATARAFLSSLQSTRSLLTSANARHSVSPSPSWYLAKRAAKVAAESTLSSIARSSPCATESASSACWSVHSCSTCGPTAKSQPGVVNMTFKTPPLIRFIAELASRIVFNWKRERLPRISPQSTVRVRSRPFR